MNHKCIFYCGVSLFVGLNVDLVCCDCCSSDEVSAVRRLLDKVDLQGYQVMDVIKKYKSYIYKLYRLQYC